MPRQVYTTEFTELAVKLQELRYIRSSEKK
jgi:hypothetical protein